MKLKVTFFYLDKFGDYLYHSCTQCIILSHIVASSIPKLSELHRLVRENDIERAILCIYQESNLRKSARDVNIQDHRGMTPLHVAASMGNFGFISFLIKSGANINARDKVLVYNFMHHHHISSLNQFVCYRRCKHLFT